MQKILEDQLYSDTRNNSFADWHKYGQEINLADLWIQVNDVGRFINREINQTITIKNMGEFCATGTEKQMQSIIDQLKAKNAMHTVRYIPPHYYKKQGNKWLVEVSYSTGHNETSDLVIKLLNWRTSYGQIQLNDIIADVSFTGGTNDVEGQRGWTNHVNGWSMYGETGRNLLKEIIKYIRK